MNRGQKVLAIIPARGGSKRIPRKNIKPFLGSPIIKYSIQAAQKSKIFDEIMVSTDDQEIADIARAYGAKVPFLRSEKNSEDYATTTDVILEVIKEYEKIKINFDYVCCIYPAAPFVTAERLIQSFKILREKNADSLIPVVKFSYSIQRALKIENNLLKMIWPENVNVRSQDLSVTYHDVGQFYFVKTTSFLKQKKLFTKKTTAIELSEMESQDIDTEIDWKISELKYRGIAR